MIEVVFSVSRKKIGAHVRKSIYIGKLILLDRTIYFVRLTEQNLQSIYLHPTWSAILFFLDRLVLHRKDFYALSCLPHAVSFGMHINLIN